MNATLQDLRLALRRFRRQPAFVFGTVLTLALGLGANAALFSVIHGVLLKPLPFPEAERLVLLWEENRAEGWDRVQASPANFLDWRRELPQVFTDVTAYSDQRLELTLSGLDEPRAVAAVPVFGNFFSVLGVSPRLGQGFREEDSWGEAAPVVVLSHRLWQQLGGDPAIVGKTLVLDGLGRTVAGVMPPDFSFPLPDLDLWVPVKWKTSQLSSPMFRMAHYLRPIGRLAPGVTPDEAQGRLRALSLSLAASYPETNQGLAAGLTPLREWIVGDTRRPLLFLFGAVGLVLLIACANVANLRLSRAMSEVHEMALREALGARRGRLVRQVLTESLLLAAAGGVLGLALGLAGLRLLPLFSGGMAGTAGSWAGLPRAEEVGLGPVAIAFTFVLSLAAGLLFGSSPARLLAWSREDGSGTSGNTAGNSGGLLRAGARATTDPRGRRTRDALVVAEVALAVVLVIGGGLLVQSFLSLRNVDPGFSPEGVLTARLSLPPARYREQPQRDAFYTQLLDRVRALPGVDSAALVEGLPLTGLSWTGEVEIEGQPAGPGNREFHHRTVSAEYFQALQVPVRRGRAFRPAEGQGGELAVVVNEAFVRRYLSDREPLGRRIQFDRVGGPSGWCTIVGVAGDERIEGLAVPPRPEVFEPYFQGSPWAMTLVVRLAPGNAGNAGGGAGPVAPVQLAAQVRSVDPALPAPEVVPFETLVADSIGRERALAVLMGLIAALASALAVVGIFAVTSRNVTERTRELGIRIALGAGPRAAVWTVVRQALSLVLTGVAIGLLAALAASEVLRGLLFETSATDLPTLAAASGLLTLVALLAALLPAARSARIDPMVCLRHDA